MEVALRLVHLEVVVNQGLLVAVRVAMLLGTEQVVAVVAVLMATRLEVAATAVKVPMAF